MAKKKSSRLDRDLEEFDREREAQRQWMYEVMYGLSPIALDIIRDFRKARPSNTMSDDHWLSRLAKLRGLSVEERGASRAGVAR